MKFRTWSKKKQKFHFTENYLPELKSDEILNLCTNLYDKNDNLIHEGDIIYGEESCQPTYWLVVYDPFYVKFKKVNFISHYGLDFDSADKLTDLNIDIAADLVIEGNVYEDTEIILKNFN